MDHKQPSLPGVPEGVPRQAIAYWDAVRRYYQPSVTRLPRNADIAACHTPRLHPRAWDRRKADLRDGKLGRDWIEVWPPPPDWRPSWADMVKQKGSGAAGPIPSVPDDGLVHHIIDEVYDPTNGKLIDKRLLRTLGHLGAVAAMFLYNLLDLSDGRLDGAFVLTRFGKDAFHGVLQFLCNASF